MVRRDSITFTVWENDPALEIQLEPEAIILTMNPGEELTFIPKNTSQEFSWTIRYNQDGIQLFREPLYALTGLKIFRNGSPSTKLDFLYN